MRAFKASIGERADGALRYSNEMRCFGMHEEWGVAREKREKKYN